MKLLFKSPVPLPVQKVKDSFNRELFIRLAPPLIPFKLERFDGCVKGNEVHILLGLKPFQQHWVSLITYDGENESGWSFIDEGKVLPWPLSYWKHHHRVDRVSDSSSLILDDIEYRCSPALLSIFMKPFLWSVFAIRPRRYASFFKDTK